MRQQTQRGAVMVEAAIYFPIVIGVAVTMIYMGLFQMQESALGYVAERIVTEAAREEAYPGYSVFGMNEGRAVDFAWSGNTPARSDVETHYRERHRTPGRLYREFGQIASRFGLSGGRESYYETKYAAATAGITMISAGTIKTPEVAFDMGFFSSKVTVKIRHTFEVPGIIRYLGIEDEQFTLTTTATKNIVNPSEFVRNTDLAWDATNYLMEKLGLEKKFQSFVSKTGDIIEKILNPGAW